MGRTIFLITQKQSLIRGKFSKNTAKNVEICYPTCFRLRNTTDKRRITPINAPNIKKIFHPTSFKSKKYDDFSWNKSK